MEPWLGVLRELGRSRGNPEWVEAFVPAMTRKGRELGIRFDFTGDVGNSTTSLRLLHYAGLPEGNGGDAGLQEALADALARGHFEQPVKQHTIMCVDQLDEVLGYDGQDGRVHSKQRDPVYLTSTGGFA